jgi:hypothetical protein
MLDYRIVMRTKRRAILVPLLEIPRKSGAYIYTYDSGFSIGTSYMQFHLLCVFYINLFSMAKVSRPNNTWQNDFKKFFINRWAWVRQHVTYRKIELLLTLGAIVLTVVSVRDSRKALSKTQEQFEISNMPLLQIEVDTTRISYYNDWPTQIIYRIKNIGKFPVKIISGSAESSFSNFDTINVEKEFMGGSESKINTYVTDQTPFYHSPTIFQSPDVSLKVRRYADSIAHDALRYFFVGYFTYVNLINKQLYRYEFVINIHQRDLTTIYNENIKLNKEVPEK